MITRRGDSRELSIFDRFQVDRNLPKYTGERGEDGRIIIESGIIDS